METLPGSSGISLFSSNRKLVIRPRTIVHRLLGVEAIRRQALLSLLANASITAAGYLSTVYIAHVAGAGVLGAYFLFLAYYSIAALLSDGGFGGAAARKISRGEDEDAFFTAQAAVRILLTVLCISAITLLAAPYMHDIRNAGLLPWLVAATGIGSVSGILGSGIYARGSVGILQVVEVAGMLIRVAVQVLAVGAGFAVAGMAGGFTCGLLASILFNARFLRLRPAAFGLRHVRALIPDASFGLASSLATVIALYADTVIVGYFLDPSAVGYYRTPLQLASLSLFAATALSVSLFPRVSRWHSQGDGEAIRHALGRGLSFSLVLAVPVVTGGLVLAERLLYFLYGSPFVVAKETFALLLVAQIGMVVFTLDSMALSAMGKFRTVFLINALSCVMLCALEILLVPAYGITGAAAAVLVTSLMRGASSCISLSRCIGPCAETRTIGRIVSIGLVMGVFVAMLQAILSPTHVATLGAIVLAGALFYFALLFRADRELRREVVDLIGDLGLPRLPYL